MFFAILSVDPSLFFCIIRGRVAGAAAWAGTPRLPSPQTLPPALPGGSQGVPRPAKQHSHSSVSWSSSESPPGGAWQEHLLRKVSRGHTKQMPKPPQLAPLDVEEQRLYSELHPGDRAPHSISKGEPRHPAEQATHFGRLHRDLILSVMT